MNTSDQPNLQANKQEIKDALGALFNQGDIVELRAFIPSNYSGKPHIIAGYFDDFDALSGTAADLSNGGAYGLYITPQVIKGDLLARALNKTKKGIKTTSDKDVLGYRYLLIDIDANRVSGVSSTDEEKKAAFNKLKEVFYYLRAEGWPEPIFGDSGNGAHLLYSVDLPSDSDLVERCIKALSFLFDDDKVIVDQKVFNPARIWKLYGTATRKGDSTPERPHRKARLLKSPDHLERVTKKSLKKLAKRIPPDPSRSKLGSAGTERAKLATWIHQNFKDGITGPISWPGKGVRWLFDECPWDPDHRDRSAFIVHFDRGGIAAGCHHEDCEGNSSKNSKGNSGWTRLQGKFTKMKPPKPPSNTPLGPIAAPTPNNPGYTDTGNALRLVNAHKEVIRFVPAWDKWLVFTGRRWASDEAQQIMQYAKNSIDAMYVEASGLAQTDPADANKLFKWAVKSGSASSRRNMISLAESEPGIPIKTSKLDSDPWKLNLLNGTLDLKTGELYAHKREDMHTKLAKVEYDDKAKCPIWDEFMLTIMGGKEHLVDYLHAYMGYSMTGVITEQTLAFLHGTGSNGKSTFLSTLQRLMGDYARQAAPELLLSKSMGSDHPTSIADLQGARFVTTSEIDRGRHFAEALIKQLTGGETVKARFMRQDFFEFEPTHKLWIAANHRPIIKGNDWAIWRRIRLIPFEVTIPDEKQDKNLPYKLIDELPGILNHILDGCLRWQEGGLSTPDEVMVATEEYKDEMDLLKEFLDDWCVKREKVRVEVSVLYERYLDWCDMTGDRKPINKKYLGRLLRERGFKQCKKSGHRAWEGLALKPHNPAANQRSDTSARWN